MLRSIPKGSSSAQTCDLCAALRMDLIPRYINSPVPEGTVVQYRDPTAPLTSWLGCWEQSGCSGTELDLQRFAAFALSYRVWFCFESDSSSQISSFEFNVPFVMASGS